MEHAETPISELLGEELDEAPVVDPEPPARDDQGRFVGNGEDEGGSPPPEPPFDHGAVKGERTRRQAAEAERDSLRQEIETLKASFQPKEPPAPPPSVYEDEDAAFRHHNAQAIDIAVQRANNQSRLTMSEMMVRQSNPDFEQDKAEFIALARENPTLADQAWADPHPWNKACQIAKNHRAMQELGATDVE